MKNLYSSNLRSCTEGAGQHATTCGNANKRRSNSRYLCHLMFFLFGGLLIIQAPAQARGFVLDDDFSPLLDSRVREIVVQPDNKVLVGGSFTSIDGTQARRFVRLNQDGTLDTSFATGIGTSHAVFAIALQDDGKIIIGGQFLSYDGTQVVRIARINTDGTLDSSFATSGSTIGADGGIYELYVATNGQVIAAGDFLNFNGVGRTRMVKLNNGDGSIDTTFNLEFSSRPTQIIPLDGNELLVAGFFTQITEPQISTFNRGGIGLISESGTVLSNLTGTGADNRVWAAARLPNNQIVIGGEFTSFNNIAKSRLALLNSDYTLNTDFQATANGRVRALLPIGDDKILLGGDFTEINSVARPHLALINLDGTLDTEFNFTPDKTVDTLAQDSKGNVFIGGDFTDINNNSRLRIAKLRLEDDELCIVITLKNGGLAVPCL